MTLSRWRKPSQCCPTRQRLHAIGQADAELARGKGEGPEHSCRGDTSTPSSDVTNERNELIIAPTARRQLAEQLPEAVAFAAYDFIIGPLLDNSQRVGKQLRPPLNDRHSARRGTYRVLYRIDDERHRVTVLGVFSRSAAYVAEIIPVTAKDLPRYPRLHSSRRQSCWGARSVARRRACDRRLIAFYRAVADGGVGFESADNRRRTSTAETSTTSPGSCGRSRGGSAMSLGSG